MKRLLRQQWSRIWTNILLAILVVVPVYAASTIGNNITTGGNIILTNGGGNLGVGTSTPANLFSVHGNVLIAGNVTSVANITATGTLTLSGTTGTSTIASGQGFTVGASQLVVQQGSGNVGVGTANPAGLFDANGKLTVLSGGNVGIGTTTPMAVLSVNSGQVVAPAGTAAAPSWAFTTDAASGMYLPAVSALGFNTGGSERVRITSTGLVGIGTTTPGTPLGVTGAAVITGTITTPNFAATSTTATSTLSTGGLAIGTNQFVVQQNSGSVGIGNSVPNTKFEVVGTASTTSLIVGGNGTTLNGVISGFCTIPATTVTASSTNYANCTGATGVLANDRVLVMATSSLPVNFIIQSASSTAAATINVQILNTGMIAGTATGINSFNFWDFR